MNNNFALRILIVEDNYSFALDLQLLVEELGFQVAAVVDSAEEALELVRDNEPDLILLDIDLKGEMSGLDLANEIGDLVIPTLFITSHQDEEVYNKAKNLGMVGFLVKPLNDFTLISAIDMCLQGLDATKGIIINESVNKDTQRLKDSLLVKKSKIYHKVKLNEIIFISSDLEYVTIHTNDDKFMFRESLRQLFALLPDNLFLRCHKSYIINVAYLKSINAEDSIAIMKNSQEVPISRRKRRNIEELWYNYG